MSMYLKNLVRLSELVNKNKISSNIGRAASSINQVIKLRDKNGRNLSFTKLSPQNTSKVIKKVVAPAFLSDANYTYLYPNATDRKLAVHSRFQNLIPTVNQCESVNSYVLLDDRKREHIGHILLYAPLQKDAAIEENSHEDNGRKFSRQLLKVSNKMNAATKMLYLSKAMQNEYALINEVISCGYWEISCVSINPHIQSAGYGTLIMHSMHKVIDEGNNDKSNSNTPTILFTSTPSALRFYQRLGYKLFMEHNINNELTSYSLIYHSDETVLKLWMECLKKNVPYYHTVDRFSFLPEFARNYMNKKDRECEENTAYIYTPELNYYFEYE